MNEQFRVAQVTGAGNSNNASPPRIFKLTKPFADQAVVLNLGYDQKVQVDFSAIANEKITLVHIGEKLIILFDNHATVTVEPFFDSRHDQLGNLTIEVAPGRDLTVAEFASAFPIINDPTAASAVLPAAGDTLGQNNAQASGANFTAPIVDPLPPVPTNVLAPQEDLGTFQINPPTGFVPQTPIPPAPTIALGTLPELVVDESFLTSATNGIDGSTPDLASTVISGLLPVTLNVPGGQQSLTFALSISAPGVDTGLIDSQTGNHVFLFLENGVVVGREGKDAATAASGPQDFTVSVDAGGKLTLTDLRSVHEGTGENGDVSEGTHVPAGLISLTATVTDNSNQSTSASVDVGPHLTLQDDGPVPSTVTGATDTLVLDESALGTDTVGGASPVGLATFTAKFGDNFSGGSYGADGAGSTVFKLVLTGSNVASGLYALDPADVDPAHPGQGAQIVLNLSGDTISGTANGVTYFTITVNETTGDVTFTQLQNLWHPNTGDSDDAATLTTSAGVLQIVQTITDADGDHVSTPIDLGTGVFAIQDDGPTAGHLSDVFRDTLILDESALGTDTAGGAAPVGRATLTANFADNFTVGSYGTDGPGTTKYTLTLNGSNVASGLYALDPADVDPAHPGQGAQIVLNQSGDTISGTANGVTYFTITINEATGDVTFTQLQNLWHPNTGNPDDVDNLTLAANTLQVVQTITDADGDHVSTPLDLSAGVFTIQDDGPVASTVTGAADTLVLDESRPEGT
ncbi:hypothetical protein GGD63_002226, partial [Bradyrhizobium sp. cir1]|uniref:DUF5801 repeats-in-toxin domain-containing protein n=1 Tax=Bradyrhizobium sp. cir1 TaxID=1445730 RepID=UPI001605E5CA